MSTEPIQELPDSVALEEFKNQVKIWMELENSIKQLQQLQRERKTFKNQLTEKILGFMARYNIDDLNTKDGRLLYKMSYVKKPLTRTTIRQRVESALSNAVPDKCTAITSIVFNQDRAQKASLSLRRVKIS